MAPRLLKAIQALFLIDKKGQAKPKDDVPLGGESSGQPDRDPFSAFPI